ncbi:MAG: phosphoglucosamine mutase, partial [Bacteroidaceae bacterium]|nr:phosphoglucosamine mutase [Bacteroidaceae bacterium]
SAYATRVKNNNPSAKKIVVGRDARMSGEMVRQVVCGTLMGMGLDVVDIGLASTPTTELAVTWLKADGGLILTASHNPRHWNALKLLNNEGEFLSAADGNQVLAIAESEAFNYADVDGLGKYYTDNTMNAKHIDSVLALELVDVEAIKNANFSVAIDCVNSVGGVVLPELLEKLGVKNVKKLYCEPTGDFQHNPEPLEKNLGDIMGLMKQGGCDVAFVVDPDVDRLAFIDEKGAMYGEEYTLVTVADYVLKHTPGNTVSNLSSTRALRDVTKGYGQQYNAAAVGEVNVVTKMKETGAVIGGEGNGGVIYPASHYGRDALVGIALFLTHLAKEKVSVSELRKRYPAYYMAKNRIDLAPGTDVDAILEKVKSIYSNEEINDIDGVKIDFADSWVHLRKSNTEPIIRVYSEGLSAEAADKIGQDVMQVVYSMTK